MPENPITVPLPQDMPTNWVYGQTIGPNGTDVGLTQRHGYNYLMQQVNAAQQAAEELGEGISGLSGDNIPETAGSETSISTALSNKAEWNASDLTSGSIKQWAESQKTNTTIAANEGASDLPYIGYWAVEFYLWTSGQWRILVATDVQTNARYYCVKNSDNAWSDWIPEATATLPNGYKLPLTDGISVQSGLSAVYSKDQFGQVIVLGSLSGQMSNGAVVATLPSGFRPIYTFEIPATCDSDAGRIQVNSLGEIRVISKLSECSSLSFLAVFVAEK